jgi:dTDP-4-amino-4,6-dideoxygalactose transaminase
MTNSASAQSSRPEVLPPRQIPFHRAFVGEEEVKAVSEVIRSGWLTMGPKTVEFENEFARYVGVEHAIAVSSGTAALHLALEAVGIGPGDEVLVPTTTFTATAEVVVYLGAKPVLVDVDARTLNMEPGDTEHRLTRRTKAMIPVHFAGQPCDLDALNDLAFRNNIQVIEDAAHALPARYRGAAIGAISNITAFSFYATKTLTTGEGGMITTADPKLAERMRLMRLHGIGRDAWKRYAAAGSWQYEVLAPGYKYNLTDIQSALGLVQLKKCDYMRARRAEIAERYTRAFAEVSSLEAPTVHGDRESAWHLYVLRLNLDRLRIGRDELIELLREQGIAASVHFIPLHRHAFYRQTYGYRDSEFPVAEKEYQRSLSLPIYPGMSDDEVQYVIDTVRHLCSDNHV